MKYIVKFEDMILLKNRLLSYIENINNEFTIIEKQKEQLDWHGEGYDSFIENYNTLMDKEKKRIYKLKVLIEFLDDVLLNYGVAIDDIMQEFKDRGDLL